MESESEKSYNLLSKTAVQFKQYVDELNQHHERVKMFEDMRIELNLPEDVTVGEFMKTLEEKKDSNI
jgi:hypothetical protein